MAYAGPSFDRAIDDVVAAKADRVIVLPMFPQYSSATTASVYDAVFAGGDRSRRQGAVVRAIAVVRAAVLRSSRLHRGAVRGSSAMPLRRRPRIISCCRFTGCPSATCRAAIPIATNASARSWRWPRQWAGRTAITPWRSSRGSDPRSGSGRARPTRSKGLHARGIRRPLVVAPGFTTDCLETLDELGNEGRGEFAHGGGDPANYASVPVPEQPSRMDPSHGGPGHGPSSDKTVTIGGGGFVRSTPSWSISASRSSLPARERGRIPRSCGGPAFARLRSSIHAARFPPARACGTTKPRTRTCSK